MTKYRVYGNVSIGVAITVEAVSPEDAIDAAYEAFPGLTGYCGNGGSDQLVGVNDNTVSLDAGCGEPEFIEVEVIA